MTMRLLRLVTTSIMALGAVVVAPQDIEPAAGTAPDHALVGAPFEVTAFNICSLNCSDGSIPTGGQFTNFGLVPANELIVLAEAYDWPRVIALNEVCGQTAWSLTAELPAGLYAASYYVSARRPDAGCALYGNWVAVRTGDIPATRSTEVHYYWDGGTPPPGDDTSENRGGPCLRSFIYLEQTWGCSAHLATSSQATTLLSWANTQFGTTPQLMLGDFNLEPGTGPITSWDNSNRNDVFAAIPVTFEGTAKHFDYGWGHQTALEFVPLATAHQSASDHHQLWGDVRFR